VLVFCWLVRLIVSAPAGFHQLQRQLVSRQSGICSLWQSKTFPTPISLFVLTRGQVTTGMNVVHELYSGYGDGAPSGHGPDQSLLQVNCHLFRMRCGCLLLYLSRVRAMLTSRKASQRCHRWPLQLHLSQNKFSFAELAA
jgi:hypothetical protein